MDEANNRERLAATRAAICEAIIKADARLNRDMTTPETKAALRELRVLIALLHVAMGAGEDWAEWRPIEWPAR